MSGGRTNIGGVEIDIRADGTLLIADLQRAEAQALAFANRASDGAKRASKDGFDVMGRAVGDVRTQMLALASVGALAGLTTQAIKAADAFTGMRSRLSLVVSESENLLEVEDRLAQVALANRADLGATVSLYARLRTARKDLSDATTTSILDAWSKTLVISGANATEAASATLQFAQAMGSGRLQGAELTAVLENNSRASLLIANSLGVPIGALKDLGAQGDLTTDVLIEIFSNAGALDAEFAKMSLTVGQAGTNLGTAFTRVIGLLDQATGVTSTLAGWIDSLATALLDVATAFGGPVAEAQSAFEKAKTAQNDIITLTSELEGAYANLEVAIRAGGDASISAARADVGALQSRIAASRELLNVERARLSLKLQEARDQLQRDTLPGNEIDDLLEKVPIMTGDAVPRVQLARDGLYRGPTRNLDGSMNPDYEAALNEKYGTREQRLAGAYRTLDNQSSAPTRFQRELNTYRGRRAESERTVLLLEQSQVELNAAISGGTKVDEDAIASAALKKKIDDIAASKSTDAEKSKAAAAALRDYAVAVEDTNEVLKQAKGLQDAGLLNAGDAAKLKKDITPKAPGADDDNKKKKPDVLPTYTTDIEDFNAAITTAARANASNEQKSRAAVKALLDYYNVTLDIEDAFMRIQALTDAGLLLPADRDMIVKLVQETDFQNTDFGLEVDDASTSLPPSFDPDAPKEKQETDYFEGFEERVKDATAYALGQAVLTGDWGKHFGDVLEGAANDAFSRSVDKLTDVLFDALASIDWGEIFGGGGGSGGIGDFLNSLFSGFGGSKAGGGDLQAGKAYRVGELGPEMFVPSTDGYMIPSGFGAVRGSPDGGGVSSVAVAGSTVVINGNADSVTVSQLEDVLAKHRRMLPEIIDARVINRRMKGAY